MTEFIARQPLPAVKEGMLSSGVEFTAMDLLNLPDHLRKTMLAMLKVGRATAEDIADITKRARAVESAYLNTLLTMGYLKKERKGRKAFFYMEYSETTTVGQ